MHATRTLPAVLLLLLGSCDDEGAEKSAGSAKAPAGQTYAECMAEANQQASRAESVMKAGECMRLPDAPPPGSTLPPGIPPPPGTAAAEVMHLADSLATIHSVYTPLDEKACGVTNVDEESQGSTSRCPGTAGYVLDVHDGDARASVDVITPDGRSHPLHYWSVVSGGFSSLGPRAEWRMRGGRPIALIVRVNASEDPDDWSRVTSYLAVAKLTEREICVTDRVRPGPRQNELARRAADASGARPCAGAAF
ncbi:MAG TPA: hypothetical protein VHG93_16470 [Longimicrobium sp.]|nr:hypothetical protein [Longimicrobium sp.]